MPASTSRLVLAPSGSTLFSPPFGSSQLTKTCTCHRPRTAESSMPRRQRSLTCSLRLVGLCGTVPTRPFRFSGSTRSCASLPSSGVHPLQSYVCSLKTPLPQHESPGRRTGTAEAEPELGRGLSDEMRTRSVRTPEVCPPPHGRRPATHQPVAVHYACKQKNESDVSRAGLGDHELSSERTSNQSSSWRRRKYYMSRQGGSAQD